MTKSITQSGLLAELLKHQRRKVIELARRGAHRKRILAWPWTRTKGWSTIPPSGVEPGVTKGLKAMEDKPNERNSLGRTDVYELRLCEDRDGFNLITGGFRCGPIWYSGPDAVRHAVEFARYRSRSLAQNATVRVLDASGGVIHTYESSDDFRW
jgi:hypothetical protein